MHIGYVKLAIFVVAAFAVYKVAQSAGVGGSAGPATAGGVGQNGTFNAFNTDMGGADFGAMNSATW